jgi:hypothetical protein
MICPLRQIIFQLSAEFCSEFFLQGTRARRLVGSGRDHISKRSEITIVDTNTLNAFAPFVTDRVQLVPGCSNKNVETPGKVTDKLASYVNASCFTVPAIVGSDGLATGFGNSGNGIINGPDQRNFDISIIKKTPLTENKSAEFRAEFFKLSTPLLSPTLNRTWARLLRIRSRVCRAGNRIQLELRLQVPALRPELSSLR